MKIPTNPTVLAKSPTRRLHKETLLGILLFSNFAFIPLYIFPSGSLQPVDFFILFIVILSLFKITNERLILLRELASLLPFILWVMLIQLSYFAFNVDDIGYLKKAAEMVYLFTLTCGFLIVFRAICGKQSINFVYFGIIISLLLIFVVPGNPDTQGVRLSFSFNNPNQLGYFAIMLLSYHIIIHNNKDIINNGYGGKVCKIFIYVSFIFAHIFVLLSLSKSAIGAILMLDYYIFSKQLKLKFIAIIITILAVLVVLMLFCLPQIARDRILSSSDYLTQRMNMTKVEDRYYRNMGRLVFKHDWQVITGIGIGYRQNIEDNAEIHNTYLMILRAYGVIGVLLFCFWFFKIIMMSRRIEGGVFITTALLLYNIFHYGLRSRSLWIFLAFLIVLISMLPNKKPMHKPKFF